MIKLYTDAATKGNHGIGGAGILIVANGTQHQLHRPLPAMSNHQAEFAAALAGFEALTALGLSGMVNFASDSKLVIQSLDKHYAKHYAEALAALEAAMAPFDVVWHWVPERENHGAHALAQQGLRLAQQKTPPAGDVEED